MSQSEGRPIRPKLPATVRCAECEAAADDQARGWRAMLGEEDDGDVMVAVFCSRCAEGEFGTN